MTTLDEFTPVVSDSCQSLSRSTQFFELPGTTILADADTLGLAQSLALIDVINAGTWVFLVFILTVDIWLQMKAELTDKIMKVSTGIKAVIYLILFACAVFWGIDGKFIDFWDAFLWIVAFFFIEMNLFEWHAEVEERVGEEVGL
jgi:fatty acid desaturase